MTFYEWNHLIAGHFFNPSKAGKEIHLFITKQEIINLGREHFDNKSDLEIWSDFILKIKNGIPGSSNYPNLFDKANHAYQQWKRPGLKPKEEGEIRYPSYITHLVFSVLPLIEIQGDYNANNYYDRLEDFLRENDIKQNLRDKLREIDDLWSHLTQWANHVKNGELGLFNIVIFTHKTWKFVGKPFSQCIFSPKAFKKLPELFYYCNLLPTSYYDDDMFHNMLLTYGVPILGLKTSVINLIKKDLNAEITQSIIDTVRKEFNKWNGEKQEIVLKDGEEKIIRNTTLIPIKLQFKINEDGEFSLSFRAKYSTDLPPGLKLGAFEEIYENENWSRTLIIPFQESFELKDLINKWTAKFELRPIRLFIRGGYFFLSNDFWIETESLSRIEGMFLLCKNEIINSISDWCKNSCDEWKDESYIHNIPPGYSLFWLRGPQKSHPHFQQLKVYTNKVINLRNGTGLKIGYRTFLDEFLPQVEITNADGKENLILQYEETDSQVPLLKHPTFGNIWLLPNNLQLNSNFFFKITGELVPGYIPTFKIVKSSYKQLSNNYIPTRNKFNYIVNGQSDFIQGNTIQHTENINTIVDGQSFHSTNDAIIEQNKDLHFTDISLIKWLIGIKTCDINNFNEVFEIVLHDLFPGDQVNVQQRRNFSIQLLDYLGYIEYNYENGKIYSLPPKLISIPSRKGRKGLLIGCRGEDLINEMIQYCAKSINNISIHNNTNFKYQSQLLMPDTIILESNSIVEFQNICNHFNIEFDNWYILKLKNFVPTLSQYEQFIFSTGKSESWDRFNLEKRVFNLNLLKFEHNTDINKHYSLTECKPSYLPEYGLWAHESYYVVDKYWGKYLLINYYSDKVKGYGKDIYFAKPLEIYFNSEGLAIPASLPLPKLYSRLLLQISGVPPDFKMLNLKGKDVWYNIYRNIPSIFSENFFKFKLNMIIEKTNQIL